MTSVIAICNGALSRLGAKTISDLSENSPEARGCVLHFDDGLRALLRQHPWNFATVQRALALRAGSGRAELGRAEPGRAEPGGTDPWGVGREWAYAYAYPTDCLTAQRIVDAAAGRPVPFVVQAAEDGAGNLTRVLLTDQPGAVLSYTRMVTDLSVCDGEFVAALQWRLAADLCVSLTGKMDRLAVLTQLSEQALARARARDAGEQHRSDDSLPVWLSAREG